MTIPPWRAFPIFTAYSTRFPQTLESENNIKIFPGVVLVNTLPGSAVNTFSVSHNLKVLSLVP